MNELRNPAKPFCQNDLNLDETMISNEDSQEEGYYTEKTIVKRLQLAVRPL